MPTDLKTILRLRVPLIVQIGRKDVTLSEVLNLAPGKIIELDKSADDELDLLVNNMPVGSGGAVKVGENFGIRISAIGSARDRMEAVAG